MALVSHSSLGSNSLAMFPIICLCADLFACINTILKGLRASITCKASAMKKPLNVSENAYKSVSYPIVNYSRMCLIFQCIDYIKIVYRT